MKAFIPDDIISNALHVSQCITTDYTFNGHPSTIAYFYYQEFTMEDNADMIAMETRLAEWNYNFS